VTPLAVGTRDWVPRIIQSRTDSYIMQRTRASLCTLPGADCDQQKLIEIPFSRFLYAGQN
jgi:hypothetical protein